MVHEIDVALIPEPCTDLGIHVRRPSAHSVQLSIIIVNWNTKERLANCLRSVFATVQALDFEVVVLDNASTDGSANMVRELFPQVRLIEGRENLGFARGNNVALKHAVGDFVLLLNPDTVVQESAIDRLIAALQACPSLGAVGAQLLNADGSLQQSWEQFPSLWLEWPVIRSLSQRRPTPVQTEYGEPGSLLDVDWATGACLMIRRQALEQVGALDESYWLYTEETDWCFRARRCGWSVGVVTDAHVVHIQQSASKQRPVDSQIQFYRSRALFLQKNRSSLSARVLWLFLAIKSAVWTMFPSISPLGKGDNEFSLEDVRHSNMALLPESFKQLMAYHGRASKRAQRRP